MTLVKDVFLHIGLPKTGTTTLQAAFEEARDAMRAEGLLFPGRAPLDQRRAAYDLLGRRIPGDDEQVAGSFAALVEEIQEFDGPAALVSEELLGLARPRSVRRLERALRPHRLHVVLGVRDLGRTIPAAWQQEVVRQSTVTWTKYRQAVQDPRAGVQAGVAFWLRHDPVRVLDAWETVIPRERIHVVTVPPPGAPPDELLARFSRVLGLRPGVLPRELPIRNRSLGVVGVEVVRRLNLRLDHRLSLRQYINVIEAGVRPGLAEVPDRPLLLTEEELSWAQERAAATIAELRRRGYDVEGDLDDLRPRSHSPGVRPGGAEVDDTELLRATEEALTTTALAQGALFKRHRRAVVRQRREVPSPVERLTSASRAAGFSLRLAALEGADRSRILGWAARRYLRRS